MSQRVALALQVTARLATQRDHCGRESLQEVQFVTLVQASWCALLLP